MKTYIAFNPISKEQYKIHSLSSITALPVAWYLMHNKDKIIVFNAHKLKPIYNHSILVPYLCNNYRYN